MKLRALPVSQSASAQREGKDPKRQTETKKKRDPPRPSQQTRHKIHQSASSVHYLLLAPRSPKVGWVSGRKRKPAGRMPNFGELPAVPRHLYLYVSRTSTCNYQVAPSPVIKMDGPAALQSNCPVFCAMASSPRRPSVQVSMLVPVQSSLFQPSTTFFFFFDVGTARPKVRYRTRYQLAGCSSRDRAPRATS